MKVLIRNRQRLIKTDLRRIRRDSLRLLTSFGLNKTELSILLVNDARMRDLNRVHRGIDKTTDVLSFPMYGSIREAAAEREILLGDIVINLHAAKRQASEYATSFSDEIRRLLIHGFLHLLGHDHEKTRYGGTKMRKEERRLRDALEALD